nr:ribulose-phosphate 3-epimerase [Bacteriovoracaceae bacterium]
PLDAHFMVTNPDFFADQFEKVKIHNFTFHWEACHHHDRMIQKLKNIYPSVGFSLNPSTPLSVIPDYLLKKVDLVLLMSVNPGFGGQSFIPEILEKIKELNQRKNKIGAHFQIQVDGGVTDKNAKILIDAGAQNLVAGSFIFKNLPQDYLNKVEALRAFS